MKIQLQAVCIWSLAFGLTACTAAATPTIPTQAPPAVVKTVNTHPTQTTPAAHPVEEAYPVQYATKTPIPTPLPTSTPTLAPPTITAQPTNVVQPLPTYSCDLYPGEGKEVIFPLPDLSSLQWKSTTVDGFPIQRLTGFDVPIRSALPSPYGGSLAIPVERRFWGGPDSGSYGLLILEGPGKMPWLAIESFEGDYHAFQWLPDNRLIWIHQGKMYTARTDGSEKVEYAMPEPALEVWSNGRRAIVSGEQALWRVNLETKQWSQIKDIGSISSPSSNAALTDDLSELLINYGGMLAQIPLDPPWSVAKYPGIQYSGHGGRIGPPSPIGSMYLFPGVIEMTEDNPRNMVLFARGKSEPIPVSSLIPLAEGQVPVGFDVSPDKHWVAFGIYQKGEGNFGLDRRIGDYIAPADDLKNGRLIPNGNIGYTYWRTSPPAYFYNNGGGITQVNLPSFEQRVLGPNAERVLYMTPELTVTELGIFDVDGNLKSLLNLPYPLDTPLSTRVAVKNGALYWSFRSFQKKGDVCVPSSWFEILTIPGL